jgi:S-adenosylmethionine:diacylglycerol 3-amino-3-carboxypropyl transferase
MKPYSQMTRAELAEATKQYDAMVIDKTRPLSAKERKLWNQAKRGRGRPKIGAGAKKVSISLEGELLKAADAMAKRKGVNRSELIAAFIAAGLRGKAG